MTELYKQILEIQSLLKKAQAELAEITWEEHHPDYPQSVFDLMGYIARSNWIDPQAPKYRLVDVLENIESANIEQIKCSMTIVSRMENWCTGSWIDSFKERQLEILVPQAIKLVKT